MPETTSRGFHVFASVPTRGSGEICVKESSRMGCGAHVWLFIDDASASASASELNVAQAKQLRAALTAFIDSAEAGELTEPAIRD